MLTKINSSLLVAKAFFKTFIKPFIIPIFIGIITLWIIFHQQKIIKNQRELIQTYQDSVERLNKNFNYILQDRILLDMQVSQLTEELSKIKGNFYYIKRYFEYLSSSRQKCFEENTQLKQQINSLYIQISHLYRKANQINTTKAKSEHKFTR